MNSILVFQPKTTRTKFHQIEFNIVATGRLMTHTDRHQQSYNLSHAVL